MGEQLGALLDRLDELEKDATQGQWHMQKFLRELRNAWPTLSRALREREWIPVTTKPPEQGDIYLTFTDFGSIEICYYGEDGWEGHLIKHSDLNGFAEDEKVTHWQPLPAAPKEEKP